MAYPIGPVTHLGVSAGKWEGHNWGSMCQVVVAHDALSRIKFRDVDQGVVFVLFQVLEGGCRPTRAGSRVL